MKLNTPSGKTAFSAIFASLALAILFAGSIFPFLSLSCVAISGFCLVPIVIEIGKRYAAIAYFAAAILGAIILPDKETAVLFTFFFGFYPILKSVFESIKSKIIEFALKFASFNAAMVAYYAVAVYLFGIPKEEFLLPWLMLAFGNFTFILYDFCLSKLIILYINVIREKILRRL